MCPLPECEARGCSGCRLNEPTSGRDVQAGLQARGTRADAEMPRRDSHSDLNDPGTGITPLQQRCTSPTQGGSSPRSGGAFREAQGQLCDLPTTPPKTWGPLAARLFKMGCQVSKLEVSALEIASCLRISRCESLISRTKRSSCPRRLVSCPAASSSPHPPLLSLPSPSPYPAHPRPLSRHPAGSLALGPRPSRVPASPRPRVPTSPRPAPPRPCPGSSSSSRAGNSLGRAPPADAAPNPSWRSHRQVWCAEE